MIGPFSHLRFAKARLLHIVIENKWVFVELFLTRPHFAVLIYKDRKSQQHIYRIALANHKNVTMEQFKHSAAACDQTPVSTKQLSFENHVRSEFGFLVEKLPQNVFSGRVQNQIRLKTEELLSVFLI